tara:strand:- start:231 stop:395 length:165 start_codon:yes stop_codon:yes gene_type:complete
MGRRKHSPARRRPFRWDWREHRIAAQHAFKELLHNVLVYYFLFYFLFSNLNYHC